MNRIILALAATLAMIPLATAQDYKDVNGTHVIAVVPLNCPTGGGPCTGTQGAGGGSSVPTGAAGTPNAGVVSVQGVGGGTALPVTESTALPAGANTIGSVGLVGSSASGNANSHAVTSALAATLVVKASAGNLYSVNATAITGGLAGYLVLVNLTAAPSTGAITPIDFCYFAANSAGGCSLAHGTLPINFGTGIVALVTTAASPYTYTAGATAAISGDYQ